MYNKWKIENLCMGIARREWGASEVNQMVGDKSRLLMAQLIIFKTSE